MSRIYPVYGVRQGKKVATNRIAKPVEYMKHLSKLVVSVLAVLVVGAGEPASRPAVSTLDQVLARLPSELRAKSGQPWTIQEAEEAGRWISSELKLSRISFDSKEAEYRGGANRSASFESGVISKRYGLKWAIRGGGKLTNEADAAFSARRSDKTWGRLWGGR